MSYAFEPREPIGAGVARIAGEQIDRIAAHLADGDIHEARKRMKEMRALLRLVRGGLGDAFDAENAWYRDAASRLSDARDRDAIRESLARLKKHVSDPNLRKRIQLARASLRRLVSKKLQSNIDATASELGEARARIATWPVLEERFATIGDGAERTLRDGRRALEVARERRTDESFHDLRMRVKDHAYHVQLLRNVWPEVMKGYASALGELSHALGDLHDLTLAANAVRDEEVRAAIRSRMAELERESLDLASRVFSEKPSAWRKRLRGYWRAGLASS